MTPDTRARAGHRRPQVGRAASAAVANSAAAVNSAAAGTTTDRSVTIAAEVARANPWDTVAPPPLASPLPPAATAPASGPRAAAREARRARKEASTARAIPLLAVMVITVAGVYIAWEKGSTGGGVGGILAGAALLVAAIARLVLPTSFVGMLAVRKRSTDVATLAILGACLLVSGLSLSLT
jgi:hypothetical protein